MHSVSVSDPDPDHSGTVSFKVFPEVEETFLLILCQCPQQVHPQQLVQVHQQQASSSSTPLFGILNLNGYGPRLLCSSRRQTRPTVCLLNFKLAAGLQEQRQRQRRALKFAETPALVL